MTILARIKKALVSHSYPETEFGIGKLDFFVLLLRSCPQGSRLTFDQSEPASFVVAFREWSHRSDVNSFGADYYTVDNGLITLVEQLAGDSELELHSQFGIGSPLGDLLCSSWDDFSVVKLAEEVLQKIRAGLTKSSSRLA